MEYKECTNCLQTINITMFEYFEDEDKFPYCDEACFDAHMILNNIPVEERPKGEYK